VTVELHLRGGSVELDHDALEALAQQLAGRVAEILDQGQQEQQTWIRGAEAAAKHLSCPVSRIYDLKAQDKLRFAKDGEVLMFRPEWLDEIAR
jgi:hypothetical protein